jgi:hypothetical protein
MTDEKDVLSAECKISLNEPKSMRKVDSLSLMFIDFYVSAHTPHLNSTETLLQLSETITLFEIYHIYTGDTSKGT